MRKLIAPLRDAPSLGQRPQGLELVLGQLDLFLAPHLARALLDRQQGLIVLAAHADLGLTLDDRQVALLDARRVVVVQPLGLPVEHELALDLERFCVGSGHHAQFDR